jgi:hypothetical protein
MILNPIAITDIIKWNIKNLLSVGLDTKKLPHKQSNKQGIVDVNCQITVLPQKLICPQVKTYPRKAIITMNIKMITPDVHKVILNTLELTYKPLPIWKYIIPKRNDTLLECQYHKHQP